MSTKCFTLAHWLQRQMFMYSPKFVNCKIGNLKIIVGQKTNGAKDPSSASMVKTLGSNLSMVFETFTVLRVGKVVA
jgi:hypothetical protein